MAREATIEELLEARAPERGATGFLRLGENAGGWRIEAFLGSGRSSEVYRAVEAKTGREAALKLLADLSDGMRDRFFSEIAFLEAHPAECMPRLFSRGETGGRPFFAMEYLVPAIPPPAGRAAAPFVRAVARAVSRIHAAGIVHRDLKPGNIMARKSGEIAIIDFGLAARVQSPRGIRGAAGVGTPPYAAPEQILEGRSSFRSDVYSLGKILREFAGENAAMREVARKATEDASESRYGGAAEFEEALRKAARPRIAPFAVAALAVAGVVCVAVFMHSRNETPREPVPGAAMGESMPGGASKASATAAADDVSRRDDETDRAYFARILALAEKGSIKAATAVGEAYFAGCGVPEDREKAVEWYGRAAAAGDADAQASMGLCRLRGFGCEKNVVAAANWFSLAAAQEHPAGMNDFAYCLLNGIGVEKNAVAGFEWAMKAAERGHAAAQTMVAECYLDGIGVAPDRERAEVWLNRAARQGNRRARTLLRNR